jgi:hypothetical protein
MASVDNSTIFGRTVLHQQRTRSRSHSAAGSTLPQCARAITGDTDLRLCKLFGLSEGYFLRLQNAYDTKRRIAAQLAKIKPPLAEVQLIRNGETPSKTTVERNSNRGL